MLQFSVYLIGLLSRLLRCNDFTGIQKVVVDQTNRRPPISGHDLSLGQDWLWEVLWSCLLVQLLSQVSLVVMCKLWVMHITIQLRNGSLLCRIGEDTSKKKTIFLIWGQLKRHPLIELLHFSNLLQMLNNCRMVKVEFFGNFSCSCRLLHHQLR